jgi:hypothetical protein
MKTKSLGLVLILSLLAPAAVRAGGSSNITVTFDNPEKFTDVKDSFVGSEKGRDAILSEIRQFIESRAKSYLHEGQQLEVTFTDIDLAGDYEPQHGPQWQDVRIVKGIYPPRLQLEFKLTGADGRVIGEGKRKLTDLDFQDRVLPPTNMSESLRYEKDLLNDWMREDLKPAQNAGQ